MLTTFSIVRNTEGSFPDRRDQSILSVSLSLTHTHTFTSRHTLKAFVPKIKVPQVNLSSSKSCIKENQGEEEHTLTQSLRTVCVCVSERVCECVRERKRDVCVCVCVCVCV